MTSKAVATTILATFVFSLLLLVCPAMFWSDSHEFVHLEDLRLSPLSQDFAFLNAHCTETQEGALFYSSSENCLFFCDGERLIPFLSETDASPSFMDVLPSSLTQVVQSTSESASQSIAMPTFSFLHFQPTEVVVGDDCSLEEINCFVYSATLRTMMQCTSSGYWKEYISRANASSHVGHTLWPGVAASFFDSNLLSTMLVAPGLCMSPQYTVNITYSGSTMSVSESTYACTPAVAGAFHCAQVSSSIPGAALRNVCAFCDGKTWRETGLSYTFGSPCNGQWMRYSGEVMTESEIYGRLTADFCSCYRFDYELKWCEGNIPHCKVFSGTRCLECEPGFVNNAGKQCFDLGRTGDEIDPLREHLVGWASGVYPCAPGSEAVTGLTCRGDLLIQILITTAKALPLTLNDFTAVEKIVFRGAQLEGQVPDYTGLRAVRQLYFTESSLSGSLPKLELYPALTHCGLYDNKFSTRKLFRQSLRSNTVVKLFLQKNTFTGLFFDFSGLTRLQELCLDETQFSESLAESFFPPSLRHLYVV
eukprot:GCRY01002792.1.p1 GENE.GCRY01002792.1~~GCRY01002792.1.p1  ORF type:complete len:534 (+),score=53.55 GCRY01002792.1:279-1880(+)